MMKKISRLAALFAATALLFGAIGCSDSEESENDGNNDDGDKPGQESPAPDAGDETEEYLGEVITLSALDWDTATTISVTDEKPWPNHQGFFAVGTTDKKITIETESTDETKIKNVQIGDDSKPIANRIKMGGKGDKTGRYIKMPLTGACKIDIWALGGGENNTGRKVQIASATAPTTPIKTSEAIDATNNTIKAVTIKMSAEDIAQASDKTFALSGDNAINIYYITIQYKE